MTYVGAVNSANLFRSSSVAAQSTTRTDSHEQTPSLASELNSGISGGYSHEEKIGRLKDYCSSFHNIMFFLPNSPNYGEQAINSRPISEMVKHLSDMGVQGKRLIVLTNEEKKPFRQDVTLAIAVPGGKEFHENEFIKFLLLAGEYLKVLKLKMGGLPILKKWKAAIQMTVK
ncbi:hypothetical protein [Chromobacterium vaccinii]|uniref:hypothetical protein n=1 Tax=Chromobacterium vaccinii TaxID=1108595 RepID=UPI0011C072AB|nr:hypothetical protein [Chromobacterium vaccinii]